MKKFLKFFLFILFLIPILGINKKVNAEEKLYDDNTYKVGIIKFDPYVKVDKDGNIYGYYIDLFDLIAEELKLNYKYVLVDIGEAIDKLEAGELDFALGVTITKNRAEKIIFNKNSIASEKFALYTNKDIKKYDLKQLDGLRFGTIKWRASDWILDFFKSSNINIKIIYKNSYDEIYELFYDDKIDLILDSAYKDTKYKKIYEFVSDQVYIAGNKNNQRVLDDIDNIIVNLNKEDKIKIIYDSYFNKDLIKKERIIKFLNIFIEIIVILNILIILFHFIKKEIYTIYIRSLIKSNIYDVYYSGVYSPKTKKLIGFEAKLKDKRKDNSTIHIKNLLDKLKDNFISEILNWQLNEIMFDYKEFQKYNNIGKEKIFISIDVPISKIKDNKFIDEFILILNKDKLIKNNICINLVGSIKDIAIMDENIKKLKESGFIIGIDDFGIEYSNLNIIQDIDLDIIKIHKSFINNLENSLIKFEIIQFMSRIGEGINKTIILNGIENSLQNEIIKNIDNNNLYVQGDFYDKEMVMKDIIKTKNN